MTKKRKELKIKVLKYCNILFLKISRKNYKKFHDFSTCFRLKKKYLITGTLDLVWLKLSAYFQFDSSRKNVRTTMKVLLVIYFAMTAAMAQGVTDGLLAAQGDLALGHAFFEENIAVSRQDLSGFIENDVRQLLDSHMEAYASIKSTSLETTAAINELEVTTENERCINAIKARWETQINRYGQRLSNCIETANRRKFDGENSKNSE